MTPPSPIRWERVHYETKMIKKSKTAGLSVLSVVLLCAPLQLLAQDSKAKAPKPPAENKESTAKKPSAGPFHGKLAALDKAAKTITVGKRTFQITAETKINKAGKAATMEDAVVGEEVSGYVKPDEHGKLVATKVNLGPKTEGKAGKKR